MTTRKSLLRRFMSVVAVTGLVLMASMLLTTEINGQADLLRKAVKKVDEQLKKAETKPTTGAESPAGETAGSADVREFQGSGRLVFSRQPIDPANPSNLSTSFSTGDHIYAALILNKSMRDFVSDQYVRDSSKGFSVTRPGFEVDFEIDGSPMFDGRTKFVFQLEQKEGAAEAVPADNFLIFDIAPDPAQARTYKYEKMFFPLLAAVGRPGNKAKAGAQFYSFQLGKLGPGDHKINLSISGREQIAGEFTISGSNYAFYKQLADNLGSVAAANAGLPKSEWNNPTLARNVGTAYRRQGGETVLKTVLISPSWFIQRNSIGVIIHRGLFAVIATRAPGGKCFMQKEYFKQLYRGANRYGPTVQDGRSETRQEIPCASAR